MNKSEKDYKKFNFRVGLLGNGFWLGGYNKDFNRTEGRVGKQKRPIGDSNT